MPEKQISPRRQIPVWQPSGIVIPDMGADSILYTELSGIEIDRRSIQEMGGNERKQPINRNDVLKIVRDVNEDLQTSKQGANMDQMPDESQEQRPNLKVTHDTTRKDRFGQPYNVPDPDFVKEHMAAPGSVRGGVQPKEALDAYGRPQEYQPDVELYEQPYAEPSVESPTDSLASPTIDMSVGRTKPLRRGAGGRASSRGQGGGGTGSTTGEGRGRGGVGEGGVRQLPWLEPLAKWGAIGVGITAVVVGGAALLDKFGIIHLQSPQPQGSGNQPNSESANGGVIGETATRMVPTATATELPPTATEIQIEPNSGSPIAPSITPTSTETPAPTGESIALPESVEGTLVFSESRQDGSILAFVNDNSHYGEITYSGQGQYSTPEARQYIHGLIEQIMEKREYDYFWNQPNPAPLNGNVYIQLEDIPADVRDTYRQYFSDMELIAGTGYMYNFDAMKVGDHYVHYTFYSMEVDSEGNLILHIANDGFSQEDYDFYSSRGDSPEVTASSYLDMYRLEVLTWAREVAKNNGRPFPGISNLGPAGYFDPVTGGNTPLQDPPGDLSNLGTPASPDMPSFRVANPPVLP